MLAQAYSYRGDHDAAIRHAETAVELSQRHPWALAMLGAALAKGGRRARAEAILDELIARRASQYVQAAFISLLTAELGRLDETFAWLETARHERDPSLIFAREAEPRVLTSEGFREDSRYLLFWERMGLR